VRGFLAGTVLVVALLVAGCGGSGSGGSDNGEAKQPATQVLHDATKAAEAASSVHLTGEVPTGGQVIGIDMTVVKGKGATGSLTLKGQKVDLVVIGNDAYMKAGATFWAQFAGSKGAAIASLVADKWIKFSATDPRFQGFTSFADTSGMFQTLGRGSSTVTNKGATTYKGQSVVNLYDPAKGGSLYVSATGTAYPVAVIKSGSNSGAITFDKWNESVTLSAPSGALDFSQLGG
jgi:hypothetical protein